MPEEIDYFSNKRTDKVYISSSFPDIVSDGDTEPSRKLRILSRVVDGSEGLEFARQKGEVVLRRTAQQRQEIKICFFEDNRQIKSVTIQKFTAASGTPHKCSFTFGVDEVRQLYNALESIRYIALESGDKQRLDGAIVDAWHLTLGEKLTYLSQQLTPEVVEQLIVNNVTLYEIVTLAQRKQQLEVFRRLLHEPEYFEQMKSEWKARGGEAVWQKFFESNPWIFGYGLRYIFMTELEGKKLEQYTSGYTFYQDGKRVDAILKTQGIVNALCFVEVKKHDTPLLAKEKYRDDCWRVSDELAGSIAQVQKTVKRFEQELRSKIALTSDEGDPTGELVFAYAPKAYVVIGSLQQFKTPAGINESKYSSFELFRRNIVSPEVVTYDELYERAKYIVAQSEEASAISSPATDDDEDLPF